jgi:hypothetical protein
MKLSKITWTEVESGIINSVYFDVLKQELYVMFNRTFDVWIYSKVNLKEYKSLMGSNSIGKYFLANIKTVKDGRKITDNN